MGLMMSLDAWQNTTPILIGTTNFTVSLGAYLALKAYLYKDVQVDVEYFFSPSAVLCSCSNLGSSYLESPKVIPNFPGSKVIYSPGE